MAASRLQLAAVFSIVLAGALAVSAAPQNDPPAAPAAAPSLSAASRPQGPPLQQQQKPPVQEEVVQQAADVQRTPREIAEIRADVYMARKLFSEAITAYQALLQQEPRNARLLNKVGIAYHQQQMLGQAKRYYERALKADPTFAVAVNNLGMVNYDRRKFKNAIRDFKKALALRPDMAATESNLGHAYFWEKQYDDALAAFRRALALDPEVFDRRPSNVGTLLQNRSVEDRANYFFFLAKSFAMAGNAERCAFYLRKAHSEGYKNLAAVAKDPTFAPVINDPLVQEVLQQALPIAQAPKS